MDLNHLISNAQHMPNIPKVVQELIESFGNKNVSSNEVANKLNKDQAMTAKVLRMANSAKYGGHHNVGSVNDAVVLLGFNALRTMVLASGLTSAFPAPEGFNIKNFWIKSFEVASISKWIAKYVPDVDPETAFTCGMIHDIGGLLIYILANKEAQEIEQAVSQGADRVETEDCQLGFNFTQAGAELAHRWKFPETIVDGIHYQLSPQTGGDYKPLAGILYIAKYLYANNKADNTTIAANFPSTQAKALAMDTKAVIEHLDELKEIDSGVEELLN